MDFQHLAKKLLGIKETVGIKGHLKCTLHNVYTGVNTVFEYDNIIPTISRTAIAKVLVGTANTCDITYGAVGTNAAAPANGDTLLGTELERKLCASRDNANNVASLSVFFDTGEGNGALKEVGFFGEAATGAANSGTMFEHGAIDLTKTPAMTLTVDLTLTIN